MKPSPQLGFAASTVPVDASLRDNSNIENTLVRKLSLGIKAIDFGGRQDSTGLLEAEPPFKRTKLDFNKYASESPQDYCGINQENVHAVPESLKETVSSDHRAYLRFGGPKTDLRRLATLNLMARQNSAMLSFEREKSQKEKEDMELVTKILERATQKQFTLESCQEISRLPLKLFAIVVKLLGGGLEIEHVGNFLTALASSGDNMIVNTQKLQCLAAHALLPQILKTGAVSIRTFYPVYEMLAHLEKGVAVEFVLVPMLQAGVTIHVSLLEPIDSSFLLKKVLQSIGASSLHLTDAVITVLKLCLEIPRFPSSPLDGLLLGAIESGLANNGKNANLGSFIYSILNRFQFTMNISQLSKVQKLNQWNETVFHDPIMKLLEKRLKDSATVSAQIRVEHLAEDMEIE